MLRIAINYKNLDVVKYLVEEQNRNIDTISDYTKRTTSKEIFDYLNDLEKEIER